MLPTFDLLEVWTVWGLGERAAPTWRAAQPKSNPLELALERQTKTNPLELALEWQTAQGLPRAAEYHHPPLTFSNAPLLRLQAQTAPTTKCT